MKAKLTLTGALTEKPVEIFVVRNSKFKYRVRHFVLPDIWEIVDGRGEPVNIGSTIGKRIRNACYDALKVFSDDLREAGL